MKVVNTFLQVLVQRYTHLTPSSPLIIWYSKQNNSADWCNKGHGMCYPGCGMMHIKEPLLLIGESSPCGGSGFTFSLSELSFTIGLFLTPYIDGVVK